MITVDQNVDLSAHSTMRLGGSAAYLTTIASEDELLEALEYAQEHSLQVKVIGSGSNIVWSGDYDGLVIVNAIEGFAIEGTIVAVGAGENWDTVVQRTVDAGLSGIEYLSLIPGTTGATPVQNVGAYGAEIADTLVAVRAYDTQIKEFVELPKEECEFGYRISRFNQQDKDRFYITQIVLDLSDQAPTGPFYKALEEYLQDNKVTEYTPQAIRDAVIAIRQSKLPDPAVLPNCGSFFKNPVISKEEFSSLQLTYPEIPGWEVQDDMKIPAAWLIDQAGYKDFSDEETGMATYEKHALVVINKSAKSIADLHAFKAKIITAVEEKFGVTLQQEPELV